MVAGKEKSEQFNSISKNQRSFEVNLKRESSLDPNSLFSLLSKENINNDSIHLIKNILDQNQDISNQKNSKVCLDYIKRVMKMKTNEENVLKKSKQNDSITDLFKNKLQTIQKKCTHISIASFIWSTTGYIYHI